MSYQFAVKHQPTHAQTTALMAFAAVHGLLWKNSLYAAWLAGSTCTVLQSVYDDFGPGYLVDLP